VLQPTGVDTRVRSYNQGLSAKGERGEVQREREKR